MIFRSRSHTTMLLSTLALLLTFGTTTSVISGPNGSRNRTTRTQRAGNPRIADSVHEFEPHSADIFVSSPAFALPLQDSAGINAFALLSLPVNSFNLADCSEAVAPTEQIAPDVPLIGATPGRSPPAFA
jgi:hypothetical protein